MNELQLLNDKKTLANSQDLLKDLLVGDPKALKLFDEMNLDTKAIKLALDFIMNNQTLSDKDKLGLLDETWRINFKSKPPTPQEFLTTDWLGPVATHTYDRIKKVFFEFTDAASEKRHLILYPHISWGKALHYGELIATPTGFKPIEEITIGEKICSTDGKQTSVINKIDCPLEKVYEVIFNDGRKVLACGNHNWKAAHSHNNKKWDSKEKKWNKTEHPEPCWKIITTEQIIEDLKKNSKHRWFIPLAKPVFHEKREHLISPYALGAYLGDGSYNTSCSVVGDDIEIHERIIRENPSLSKLQEKNKENSSVNYITYFNAEFKHELDRLGLKDCKCDTKFIPEEYLYDSLENRISLLQGLMDTDGTLESNSNKLNKKRPRPSFWTSSEKLANDIAILIRGLGGIARLHKYEKGSAATCNYDAHIINFHFPEQLFNVFYLKRKQDPLTKEYNRERKYKEQRKPQYLYIKEIKETELKGGQCIEVDNDDHCFLTNSYIVTHNSYISTMITLYNITHVSLMRNPWKYFGLNPASMLAVMLCSYSLKKSSELLLEPFNAMLESSPIFEKVHSREKMRIADEEFRKNENFGGKIYYTTASPTSELSFSGGMGIKLGSNPNALLGLSLLGVVYSELAFFTDAGKALYYKEKIKMKDGNFKEIGDIQVGDKLYSPTTGYSTVTEIPYEGLDDMYEIELDDGNIVKCHANHLWPCKINGEIKTLPTHEIISLMEDNIDIELLCDGTNR